MRIAIVGQGAIASLFAFYWRAYKPVILVKPEYFKEHDYRSSSKSLLLDDTLIPISSSFEDITQAPLNAFDVIVITVKSYQLSLVINQIKPWLIHTTRIMLVQNGMGGLERLLDGFPSNKIYVGTTTDAVHAKNQNTYYVNAMGCLDIGRGIKNSDKSTLLDKNIDNWALEFLSHHPNYEWHQNIHKALYTKLAVNAVINPLSAKLSVKNGELKQYPSELHSIKQELFMLYETMQIDLNLLSLNEKIDKVINDTANNYSSMCQDISHKRQTEIDSVLGYLLRHAQHHQIPLPFMNRLYHDIVGLQSSYLGH